MPGNRGQSRRDGRWHGVLASPCTFDRAQMNRLMKDIVEVAFRLTA
jgi:hypothetical protein